MVVAGKVHEAKPSRDDGPLVLRYRKNDGELRRLVRPHRLDAGPVAVLTEDFAVKLVQVDGPSLDLKHRPIDGMFRHPLLEVRLHEVVTGERGDGERPRSADSVRGRVRASIRIGLHTAMRLCAPIRYG